MTEESRGKRFGSLLLTHENAIIQGTRYPLASLKSVTVEEGKPGLGTGIGLVAFTVILMMLTTRIIIKLGAPDGNQEQFALTVATVLLVATTFASGLATVNTFRNRKTVYKVMFTMGKGEPEMVMEDIRKDSVDEVVAALKDAMAAR